MANEKRISSLDGIRAIAISLVILARVASDPCLAGTLRLGNPGRLHLFCPVGVSHHQFAHEGRIGEDAVCLAEEVLYPAIF
jgi:hypothetical protein